MQLKRLCMVLVLIIACGSFTLQAREAKKVVRATVGEDGVQRVEVVGGGYFFNPDHIIVKVNVPVELKVRKESGLVPHNIVVKAPEAGIDFEVGLGSEPKSITFTPTRVGLYPFYCGKKLLFLASHREKGMEGVLEVVDK